VSKFFGYATVWAGSSGDDTLDGGAGRDALLGGEGDDLLHGGDGNDFLEGGAGADVLDGGAGIDSVNYHGSDAGVTVDLGLRTADGGHAEGDTLIGIESVRGSTFDDVLIGSDGDNFLCGLGGNDSVYGGAGNDILRGAEDADHLDGGTGFDTVTYWSSDAGVTVDLESGTGTGGHAEGDTLVSIESVKGSEHHGDTLTASADGSILYGYGGDDVLAGLGGVDILTGGIGDDALSGGPGNDQLFGDDGTDTLDGSAGDDLMTAGAGDDVLTGGAGEDSFKFRTGDGTDTITDFEAGIDHIVFSDGQTTWRDIVTTEIGDDTLIEYGTGDSILVLDAGAGDVWGGFDFY